MYPSGQVQTGWWPITLQLAEGALHHDLAKELKDLHQKTHLERSSYLSAESTLKYLVDFIEELDTTEFYTYHQTRDAFHFASKSPGDSIVCPDMFEVEYIETSQTFKLSVDHSIWDSSGCENTFAVYWLKINPEEVTILAINEPYTNTQSPLASK